VAKARLPGLRYNPEGYDSKERPVPPRPPFHRPRGDDDKPLAVALKYDRQADAAPRVVAKGDGEIAEAILALAREHGVAVREDKDLAQLLAAVELETQIPVEAFVAVAEILSYVYRSGQASTPARTPR
jgi:flagellar biosynthesis protein